MKRKELHSFHVMNHASCITPKRGMARRAKRHTAKKTRQALRITDKTMKGEE